MSASLTVLSEIKRGEVFHLTEVHYGVGRHETMEIQFIDPSVSGMHCELVRNEDGSYRVVDEGCSTNGTRINGHLVSNKSLQHGDILQVGSVECYYESEAGSDTASIGSTQRQIEIDAGALVPNKTGNFAPQWLQNGSHPKVQAAFKVVMGMLVITVVLLVGLVAWKLALST